MLWFLLIFIATPLIELYFLISLGSVIGALPTIALAIFTAALGGYLVRAQGLSVLMRVRAMLAQGETPAFEMLDGAILLVCGFSLLLPGLVTDMLGFVLLIPPLRHALLRRYLSVLPVRSAVVTMHSRVVDADYRRELD